MNNFGFGTQGIQERALFSALEYLHGVWTRAFWKEDVVLDAGRRQTAPVAPGAAQAAELCPEPCAG